MRVRVALITEDEYFRDQRKAHLKTRGNYDRINMVWINSGFSTGFLHCRSESYTQQQYITSSAAVLNHS